MIPNKGTIMRLAKKDRKFKFWKKLATNGNMPICADIESEIYVATEFGIIFFNIFESGGFNMNILVTQKKLIKNPLSKA